jgi:hypothetical protein
MTPLARKRLWRLAPFVAVNLVFAALAALALAALWNWAFVDDDGLAERREVLADYRAVAGQENAARDFVRQVREGNAHGDLLEGPSAGVINAALQSRLKAMGEAAGVNVQFIQALPARKLGGETAEPAGPAGRQGAQLYGARMAFAGTAEATHRLTLAIESGPPLLLIVAAVMSHNMIWRPPGEDQQILIQSQFDIYGGALEGDRP